MNPFATRCTRPGALPYLFRNRADLRTLLARLKCLQGPAQITGPHGSGKSTLVATIREYARAIGRPLVSYALRKNDPSIQRFLDESARWNGRTLYVVDGFDLLTWPRRWHLLTTVRRRRCGLLVTTHRKLLTLPVLHCTHGDLEMTQRVVDCLLPDSCNSIRAMDVARCFRRHRGNVRETLFALYDLYEERRC